MRNYLHVAAAAIAAFVAVGCSNDEVVNAPEKTAISFDNAFVDKATRTTATDPSTTTTSISEFTVYGYQGTNKLFDGQKVTKDGSDWTYSPLKYWVAGEEYKFVAISALTARSSELSDGTFTTVASFESDGKIDPLASTLASQKGEASGNDVVKFTFKHLLAKIKFTFKNGFTSNDDVTLLVKNVKVTDAYQKGTVTVAAASATTITWSDQSTDLELSFGKTEEIAQAGKDEATDAKLIIPSTGKDYTVKFDVEVIANADQDADGAGDKFTTVTYSHEVTLSGAEFVAGTSYNLIAELNAKNVNPDNEIEPIVFAVNEVETWVDASDDVTVVSGSDNSTDDDSKEDNSEEDN
jgi:hypothetical protein